MKVTGGIDILKQYDPLDDVAVATQHDEAYFNFKSKSIREGELQRVDPALWH